MEKQLSLSLYKQMLRIRRFEEKLLELFSTRLMPGTIHQCNGQEAVAAGVCEHLNNDDYVVTTHRGHGHALAKGADMNAIMAEIFAKTTGCCKALGGSMHIADVGVGFLGGNGIVGAGIPIATGVGLSCQYKKKGAVSVAFFGDGASNEGAFHEAINLAAIWKLPVVFVCENNLYGYSTHYKRTMLIDDISDRAAGYGIPGVSVDGMDVQAVYAEAGKAIERARKGDGPTLIECKTYRYRGHSRFEDPSYRTKEELNDWLEKDPIRSFCNYLKSEQNVSTDELVEMEDQILKEIEQAIEFADESPDPKPLDYQSYIYS
jgi:acetoin:2,6-dichlorophenolindophenol oxidoreductase subunit alpha